MRSAPGPLPRIVTPLSWLLARCYGAAVSRRNARFDRGIGVEALVVRDVRVPVISVGNMTAGGTGKSPFVARLADELISMGRRPVIAMRGYRSHTEASGASTSDEQREYAVSAPNALVVADPRRRDALVVRLSQEDCASWLRDAVVLLDDGFQHRQLSRALDIVLVDATRPALDGDVLPHGWLREDARGIRRANFVVLTKADDANEVSSATALVRTLRGTDPDAVCRHVWDSVEVYEAGRMRMESLAWLATQRTATACGLGNPSHFERMTRRLSAELVQSLRVGDHRALATADIDRMMSSLGGGAVCVVSRKDFVKFDATPTSVIVVPRLAISFAEHEAGLLALRTALRAAIVGS